MQSTPPQWNSGLSDADLRNTMLASLRLLAALCAVGTALFWWKLGWRSGVLVVIGSAISAASLWEWMRLMTFMNVQMDAGGVSGGKGGASDGRRSGRVLPAAGAYPGGALC